MGKVVGYKDIFDFSNPADIDKAIKALSSLLKVYDAIIKKSATGAKQIKANNDALVKSLNDLIKTIVKLDETNQQEQKTLQSTNAQVKALNATYEAQKKQIIALEAQIKKLTKEKLEVNKATKAANASAKESIRLETQLAKATGEDAKKHAELKIQILEANKAAKQRAKEALGLVSLYQKESATLNDLRNKYKNVALAQGQNSKAAKQLLAVITPLDNKLKQIDATVGQGTRSVGQYGKAMLSTGKQFLAAFGIFGGITIFANLIRDTFALIKETERYNKALRQVTETNQEYADELIFLTSISNKYGINLNSLTDSYTKFFVATKNTNLEGEETRRIFDSVSKSAAVMALSAEDTEGALKALGQMISKGKVQAEELRGQLGDRLPGAFAIMAEALDVTTGELDKMLKDGKLLAVDVLPKFARQLEITFGLDKVQSIETLQAAQTRLTNEWIEFVRSVEDGNGVISDAIRGIISETASLISIFKAANEETISWGEALLSISVFSPFIREATEAKIALKQLNEEMEASERAAKKAAEQSELNRDALLQYKTAVESGINSFEDFTKIHGDFFDESERDQAILARINDLFSKYSKELEIARVATVKLKQEQLKMFGSISSVQDQMRAELELSRKVLQKTMEDSNLIFGDGTTVKDGAQSLLDIVDSTLREIGEKENERKEKRKKDRKEELDADRELQEQKQLIQETGFESASIIGNQLFENGRINRENELIDLQRQKEFELELAGDNADKRAEIEKKFAQEEKKLRIQQAQAAKKQALFNIALNTAEGITKTIANLGLPAAVPFIIAATTIGAAETAAVISKPLPAFEEGGISPGGDIITSEKGREMAVTPSGKLILTGNKGAEIRKDMPKGTAILNNPITEKILKNGFDHAAINNDATLKINQVLQEQRDRSTMKIVNALQQENDILIESLGKKIENMPRDISYVEDGDFKKMTQKGNDKRNWRKSKNSMNG